MELIPGLTLTWGARQCPLWASSALGNQAARAPDTGWRGPGGWHWLRGGRGTSCLGTEAGLMPPPCCLQLGMVLKLKDKGLLTHGGACWPRLLAPPYLSPKAPQSCDHASLNPSRCRRGKALRRPSAHLSVSEPGCPMGSRWPHAAALVWADDSHTGVSQAPHLRCSAATCVLSWTPVTLGDSTDSVIPHGNTLEPPPTAHRVQSPHSTVLQVAPTQDAVVITTRDHSSQYVCDSATTNTFHANV